MPQYHYSPSLEVNARKEAEANKRAWQQNAASLPDNAFADDVVTDDEVGKIYHRQTEIATGWSQLGGHAESNNEIGRNTMKVDWSAIKINDLEIKRNTKT
jgi:hypothetical protein